MTIQQEPISLEQFFAETLVSKVLCGFNDSKEVMKLYRHRLGQKDRNNLF